jgi:predicted DNA-binding transcriptional regulator YafY
MSNVHRIAWIDAQIREGRYPNANTVAERFEISRRQAARDIEYLRHTMGAPLEYSAKENGYIYRNDAFVLPAVVISDAEQSALSYLTDRYAAADGEAAARVTGVLRRLAGRAVSDVGSDEHPPVMGLKTPELRAFDSIRSAIEERQVVTVRYRGADGQVVTRTLSPYAILTRFGALSCVAYCDEFGYTNAFPLARFESVERTEGRFEIPALLDVNHWADDHRPVQPEPFIAIVRLQNEAEAERFESAEARGDGTYSIEFFDSAEILASLLSCRSDFEILTPNWLRDRLRRRLEALLLRTKGPEAL